MHRYFLKTGNLYYRVSVIHLPVVLFSLLVVSNIAPIIEPGLEKPIPYALFLLFLVYSLFFVPLNLVWCMIVAAFPHRFYLRAGIALAILFQTAIIVVGIMSTPNPDFITWQSGANMVILGYAIVLVAGLFWSYPTETHLSKTVQSGPDSTDEFR